MTIGNCCPSLTESAEDKVLAEVDEFYYLRSVTAMDSSCDTAIRTSQLLEEISMSGRKVENCSEHENV